MENEISGGVDLALRTFHKWCIAVEEMFGLVIIDDDLDVEKIKLKVSAKQANYWRSLPLHHSQQEIERTEQYSIFVLKLCPTYDFLQKILRNGEDMEVLEPLSLRAEMASKIKGMWDKYQQ